MFYVIFRNDINNDYTITSGPHPSIEVAQKQRHVSGDLITDEKFIPVQNNDWLWAWEDSNAYANRMIRLAQAGQFKVGVSR